MDLIYAARYVEACEYSYKQGITYLPGGIWHVDTASIPEFFEQIDGNNQQYVVVSPSCDFGVMYQKYNHPASDLKKWTGLQINQQHGYNDLHMQARINPERCKETDTYSIKCWSYTEATFNKIPPNVTKWFLCNCEVEDPRIIPIPFGIFGNRDKLETANAIIDYQHNKPPSVQRDKLLYVNFQFYTTDRAELFFHFKNHYGDLVTCKKDIPFDEYLEDLATHKFILCPTGNGLDCYRTLETIYMGAIPIIEQRMGAIAPYEGLAYPLVYYPSMYCVDPRWLEDIYHKMTNEWSSKLNLERALWPYWEKRIEDAWQSK